MGEFYAKLVTGTHQHTGTSEDNIFYFLCQKQFVSNAIIVIARTIPMILCSRKRMDEK